MNQSIIYPRPAIAGSAILMGLVVMALGTFGVAAWISLLSSRAFYIESMELSSNHRVAKINARAVADEFIYSHGLAKVSVPAASITLPDGLGIVEMASADTAPLASLIRPPTEVSTGMANGYGYHVDLPVSVTINVNHDNDPATAAMASTYNRSYLLKSRAPQLVGDLMVMHKSTLAPSRGNELSGQIRVHGNTVIWSSGLPVIADSGIRSERYITYTQGGTSVGRKIRNLEGNWMPPANYPLVTNTAGEAEGSNAYDGRLDVIDPGPDVPWSMKNKLLAGSHIVLSGDNEFDSGRGASSDGAGNIHLTLGDSHLTSVMVGDYVKTINLHGQSNAIPFANAGTQGAVVILIHQTITSGRSLRNIIFRGSNNRRLLLVIKRDDPNAGEVRLTFADANDNPSWRLMLIAENCRMTAGNAPNGTVSLYGGIRTDRDFKWSVDPGKILHIHRETDAGVLERLVPRTAWIESYAN